MAKISSGSTQQVSGLRELSKNLANVSDSFAKLSSGKRIAKASDDAAALAIVASLDTATVTMAQASRNISDISSALAITDGATDQIQQLSTRLTELVIESSNGTYSDMQRAALQQEYKSTVEEIQRIGATTNFNGVNLLGGQQITAQVGTDGSSDSSLSTPSIDIAQMVSSISLQDISTAEGAAAAISAVDDFSKQLSYVRGSAVGATQSRLDSIQSTLSAQRTAAQQASTRIADVDVAEESAKLTASQVRAQIAPALAAQVSKLNASITQSLLG